MNVTELKANLRSVIDRYCNKTEFFGEVRRDDMARDCLHAVEELEAENARLKAQLPRWISVKDRLPDEKEQYKLLWVAYVRTDNTIKYMYEASFDYYTKQFYTENDWGDKTFVEPSVWMIVPPPPPTEGSAVIEKANG